MIIMIIQVWFFYLHHSSPLNTSFERINGNGTRLVVGVRLQQVRLRLVTALRRAGLPLRETAKKEMLGETLGLNVEEQNTLFVAKIMS